MCEDRAISTFPNASDEKLGDKKLGDEKLGDEKLGDDMVNRVSDLQ